MATRTMEEQAEQMLASDAYEDAEGLLFPEGRATFGAGWDAGVAWARLQERRRLADCARLRAAIQEAGTLLDFEANLGDPKRAPVLREVVRMLTVAIEPEYGPDTATEQVERGPR